MPMAQIIIMPSLGFLVVFPKYRFNFLPQLLYMAILCVLLAIWMIITVDNRKMIPGTICLCMTVLIQQNKTMMISTIER